MKVGLYVRVYTDEQAKEGFSIAAQLRMLNAWAVLKNADSIEEYIDDGYSAKNLNRPAVKRLLADCEARKLDVVVVWRLDRLSRNLRDLLVTIEDVFKVNGVEFVSATENIDTSTPSGRLTLNILGSVAQNERENTSERVVMVMNDLAKQCKHLGGKPMHGLGVTSEMDYYIIEEEAVALRMAVDMRIEGRSINNIIDALTASGHFTRSGKPFTMTGLYEIFRNPKIAGIYVYNRSMAADRNGKRNNHAKKSDDDMIIIPGGIPAIISMDKWEMLQMINDKGKNIGGQNHAKNVYIVSGLCFCGKCGGKMSIANGGRNRDGSYWRAYRCKNKCVPGIEYKKMDNGVIGYLKNLASDPNIVERAISIAQQYIEMQNDDFNDDLQPLYAAVREAENAKDNLVAFVAKAGADAPHSLISEIEKCEDRISDLNNKINAAKTRAIAIDKNQIIESIKKIIDIDALTDADKKDMVRSLVRCVVVHEDIIEIQLATTSNGGPEALPEVIVKLLTFQIARSFFAKKSI